MARRKKAWGPSNPLWRYLHRKGKRASKPHVRHRRRSESMARRSFRRYYGRARRSYRRGGGMNSIIKGALMGGLASFIAPKVGINFNPLAIGAAGGYLLGGKSVNSAIGGAVGSYAANMFLGGQTSSGAW